MAGDYAETTSNCGDDEDDGGDYDDYDDCAYMEMMLLVDEADNCDDADVDKSDCDIRWRWVVSYTYASTACIQFRCQWTDNQH